MIEVELAYTPRTEAHIAVHNGLESHRWGCLVTHRRWGKTVLSIVHLLLACLENPRKRPEPRYGFIAPFRDQAKSLAWTYLLEYAASLPGVVPLVSELKVITPNGGHVRLFGADNPHAFRGGYFDGIVLDEYGQMAPNVFSEILRPTLSDYNGFAVFAGTPAGKNQFWHLVHGDEKWVGAERDPAWFFARYKASESGLIPAAELAQARQAMTQDEYEQEFECSFEASVKGSIFGAELATARSEGRLTRVPVEPVVAVDTVWDLGVGDSSALWFVQSFRGGEVRVVDYYEASGEGLPHYAQVLRDKGYTYGTHYAPHDIQVRELGSGRSRLETAASLGIRFAIVPQVPLEDGIHAARMLLPRCWFDEDKCKAGLDALQYYRRDYNTRLNEFKAQPVHDWASHGADAFRYLALVQQPPKAKRAEIWPVPLRQPSAYEWMK
jgi:hypothetical protein